MRGPCWTLNNATVGTGRTYPAHQEMGRGYNYAAGNSVHKLPYDALPDSEPNFNTVVIHGHAKLTDLLSSEASITAVPELAGLDPQLKFSRWLETRAAAACSYPPHRDWQKSRSVETSR